MATTYKVRRVHFRTYEFVFFLLCILFQYHFCWKIFCVKRSTRTSSTCFAQIINYSIDIPLLFIVDFQAHAAREGLVIILLANCDRNPPLLSGQRWRRIQRTPPAPRVLATKRSLQENSSEN